MWAVQACSIMFHFFHCGPSLVGAGMTSKGAKGGFPGQASVMQGSSFAKRIETTSDLASKTLLDPVLG